jgi:hypothetical protein
MIPIKTTYVTVTSEAAKTRQKADFIAARLSCFQVPTETEVWAEGKGDSCLWPASRRLSLLSRVTGPEKKSFFPSFCLEEGFKAQVTDRLAAWSAMDNPSLTDQGWQGAILVT